jgi:arabinogalactan oligomer / maltooligosaccharide transport system permease protein
MVINKNKKMLILSLKYLFAVILIVFAIVPFLWVLGTSFNQAKSLMGASLIPKSLTIGNYNSLLNNTNLNFSRWMINSLKISSISVFIIVTITCISSYALSRFRFAGKKNIMLLIMILNVFPGILAMIAIYTMMQQIGSYIPFLGLNTHGGLILIYVAGSMSINTLMVKAYIDSVPMELDESALIEGASHWQTYWKIIFPVIRPIVITIGILAAMTTYGDFIIANILLKGNENITVMVGIFQFTQQRFNTDWGQVTAGTVIAALPVITLFFMAQKYIMSGLTAGSVKG